MLLGRLSPRVRVELLETPKQSGVFGKVKNVVPIITACGTLIISAVSIIFVVKQDRDRTDFAASEARRKALEGAFVEGDDKDLKQDIAASSVIFSGKPALQAIRMLLIGSPDHGEMRGFGIKIAKRWMDAGNEELRTALLDELVADASTDVGALRCGAFAALSSLTDKLTPPEKRRLLVLLQDRFGSGDKPVETDSEVTRLAVPCLAAFSLRDALPMLRNTLAMNIEQALETSRTMVTKPAADISSAECNALLTYVTNFKSSSDIKLDHETAIKEVSERCSAVSK